MKKIIIIASSILLTTTLAFATTNCIFDNERPVGYGELPAEAQSFLETHFATVEFSHAILDQEILGDEYQVMLSNGTKIEFDDNGNWTEVDCRHSAVPAAIVPAAIAQYVNDHYAGSTIVELKRERNGWEAKIDRGLELTFNNNMQIVEIDD